MYKWKPDDEDIMECCFESDWDCGKVPKVVKDENE